jgi:hypothetical protein
MMSQQEISVLLFLASIGFTFAGNVAIGYINTVRLIKHAQDEKILAEMIEMAKASSTGKKKKTKRNYGFVEVEKPRVIPAFNFWIILLMTVAAYALMAATL